MNPPIPAVVRAVVAAVALTMIPVAWVLQPTPIELRFIYTPDAAAVLAGPIEAFNDEYDGEIHVVHEDGKSGETEADIADGVSPDLWMPASSAWAELANFDATGDPVPVDNPSYFYSPMVFASWSKVNARVEKNLGEPMGWGSLAELNRLDREFDRDGPLGDVSPFRFGHTRATTSTSGLYAAVSAYLPAMEVVPAQLTNAANMRAPGVVKDVRDFELSVRNYGDIAKDFCPPLARFRAAAYSALFMQETILQGCRNQADGPKELLEIYPAEGSYVADYPFIVVTSDPERERAAEAFRSWMSSHLDRDAILGEYLRLGDPKDDEADVLPDGVEDALGVYEPLSTPDVEVLAQARLAWSTRVRKIGHVQVLLDHSGAMNDEGRWVTAVSMVQELIGRLDTGNHVGLTTFDEGVHERVPLDRLDVNRVEFDQALDPATGPAIGSPAVLSEAILDATSGTTPDEDEAIDIVLVFSAGQDSSSAREQHDALEAVVAGSDRRSPIQVFTVFMGDSTGEDSEHLAEFAEKGRGDSWQVSSSATQSELDDIVTDISSLVPQRA